MKVIFSHRTQKIYALIASIVATFKSSRQFIEKVRLQTWNDASNRIIGKIVNTNKLVILFYPHFSYHPENSE